MSCCPAGSWPALEAEGGPSLGKIEQVAAGLDAYVVAPEKPNGTAILSFNDIFGFAAGRTKGVLDQLAMSGYYVVHPDVFKGGEPFSSQSDMSELPKWVQGYPFDTHVLAIAEQALDYIKKNSTCSKIAVLGICWGAYNALRLVSMPQYVDTFVASVYLHPAFGLNAVFGGSPDALEHATKTKIPQLLVPAGNDPESTKPGGVLTSAMISANAKSKSIPFEDMSHGWTVRGDVSDKAVEQGVKGAVEAVLSFLEAVAA
ncbi:Carboxymethylenebutenolidase-like [Porphyridium purpureum]|uniref:Carboxymethylenebutenolidase-like n=1 Tax=Porphyridium purpureum TaxID=35688 RepID=A0A5J4YTH1_PORPP|nr:Carboxymethylenebutenolidase-like [Porphyridium purpureum]|eukprot:POR0300..scf227_4